MVTRFCSEDRLVPYQPGFPPGKRWLFLGPHPDDETVAAGATLALGVRRGVEVRVVVVTQGQAQGDAVVREQEAREAIPLLGVQQLRFLGLADRRVAETKTLPKLIASELRDFSPELVFLPSPVELHPDHRSLAWQGQRVLRCWSWFGIRRRPPGFVAFYEVGSALWPNLLVAGDEAWEQKRQALACYRSQLAVRCYQKVMEGLADFRTLTLHPVAKAEGFAVFPVRQVVRRSFRQLQRLVGLPPVLGLQG